MVAVTSPALSLVALACPVGMIVMMAWMMKGMGNGRKREDAPDRDSLASLKAEHARLAERIAELEAREANEKVDEAEQTRV
jgi:hypothetical protein